MQKRRETPLSLSISSALLGTGDRKEAGRPALAAALVYDLNSIGTRGAEQKETIRNKVEGTWVTLNVPRSSRLKFVAFGSGRGSVPCSAWPSSASSARSSLGMTPPGYNTQLRDSRSATLAPVRFVSTILPAGGKNCCLCFEIRGRLFTIYHFTRFNFSR